MQHLSETFDPRRQLQRLVCIATVFAELSLSAKAEPMPVYDGMTAHQVAEFASQKGWKAEVGASGADVTIHIEGQRVYITMLECAERAVCRSGIIRNTSYHFIESTLASCNFWHWNQSDKGATGFGPDYVTLQRYIRFRGVTSQYLEDVIKAWLTASVSFWKLVNACATDQKQSP